MANARTEEIEESLQDGNCAFNSFALALCTKELLAKIEHFIYSRGTYPDHVWHHFIKLAAAALNVTENWLSVKLAMLEWREKDKAEFQKKLAKVFRMLAHDLAKTHIVNEYLYYYNKTIAVFQAAFLDYIPNDKGSKDDIFCRHEFIEEKFKEFKRNDVPLNAVMLWWMNNGYEKFLDAMSKNAEHAGDLELARLARYFNLSLLRLDGPSIYRNFGYFPDISTDKFSEIDAPVRAQIMVALVNRGIVDKFSSEPGCGFKFNLATRSEMALRLQRIKHFDLVNGYIRAQTTDINGTAVPKDWPEECVAELVQRNVIGRLTSNSDYTFSRDTEKALRTIEAIPQQAWVKSLCFKHLETHPEVMLKHKFFIVDGEKIGHWDNVIIKDKTKIPSIMLFGLYKPGSIFDGSVAAKYVYQCLTTNKLV